MASDQGVPSAVALANRGISFAAAKEILKRNGLPAESDFRSNRDDFIPKSLNAIRNRKYVVQKIAKLDAPLTFAEIKKLIDNEQPIQAVISTDARRFDEDWIRILPQSGSIAHVLNVVGYGQDYDPADNKKKDFIWVRDSFTPGELHHKASVESFLPWMGEALRVKEVGTLKEPITYPKFDLEKD